MKKLFKIFIAILIVSFGFVYPNKINEKTEVASAANTYDTEVLSAFSDNENLALFLNDNSEISQSFNVLDFVNYEFYDQNPFGTCYAMSLAQMLNLSYEYRTNEHIRLSPLALALQVEDLFFSEGSNDFIVLQNSFNLDYISEFDFPYELANVYYEKLIATSDVIDIDFNANEIIDVEEYYVFPYSSSVSNASTSTKQTYINIIKRALESHGALATGISYKVQQRGEYFVYDSSYTSDGMHAMTIVGYDDNFSKSNFKSKHTSDGAFLIMNSWGTEEEIIYISYEDFLALEFIYGVADFLEPDENISEIKNISKSVPDVAKFYLDLKDTEDLEFGYQISNNTEKTYLSEIDFQPINILEYEDFYNTSLDVKIYINENSNSLSGADTYLGDFDISAGLNKIKLETPVEVGKNFAIKIKVVDSSIKVGFMDANSQNFSTLFYENGSWRNTYLAGNYNLIATPFYVKVGFSDNVNFNISKEENYQGSLNTKKITYDISSSEEIFDIDVEVLRHENAVVSYDTFSVGTISMSNRFNIEITNSGFSIQPKSFVYGTYKLVISVNGNEKTFIKFLEFDDGMGLTTVKIDSSFYLRLFETSLESEVIDYNILTGEELQYLNADKSGFILEEMFLYDTENVSVSASYEYDEFSRIKTASISFRNVSTSVIRSLVLRFNYEARCKIIYVTNIPNATHDNPEFVANGQETYFKPATAPNYEFVGWFTSKYYNDQRAKFTPIVDGAVIHFYGLFTLKESDTFVKNVSYDEASRLLVISLDFSAYDLSMFDMIEFSSITHNFKTTSSITTYSANLTGSTYDYKVYVESDSLDAVNSVSFDVTLYRSGFAAYASSFPTSTLTKSVEAYYQIASEYFDVELSCEGSGKFVNYFNGREYGSTVQVPYHNSLYLKFEPSENYYVYDVIVDGVSVGACDRFTFEKITQNHTVYVVFKSYDYSITVKVYRDDLLISSQTGHFILGENKSYSLSNYQGYYIKKILVNGKSKEITNILEFKNISENYVVEIYYEKQVFTITITSVDENGVVLNKETREVKYGVSESVSFNEIAGYELIEVWVDGSIFELCPGITFNQVSANHTVKLVYEKLISTITFDIVGQGTVEIFSEDDTLLKLSIIDFDITAFIGEKLIYKFTPSEGFYLKSIVVDDVKQTTSPRLSHTISRKQYLVVVTFEINPYELRVNVNGHGQVNHDLFLRKNHGETISYLFTPDEGYFIDSILVNGVNVGNSPVYDIIKIDKNYNIVVNFVKKTYTIIWKNYNGETLKETIVSHGDYPEFEGTLSRDSEGYVYYQFSGWNTMIDGTGSSLSNATENTIYYAQFIAKSKQFVIMAMAGEHGSISPEGSVYVDIFKNKTFSFIPDSGYHISKIVVDGEIVDIAERYTFENVIKDHSISVQFKRNDFSSIIVSDTNYGEVVGGKWFESGERATFKINVKQGYEVKSVIVNGNSISVSNNQFIIENVNEDLEIVVSYQKIEETDAYKNIKMYVVYAGVGVVVISLLLVLKIATKKKKSKNKEYTPYR